MNDNLKGLKGLKPNADFGQGYFLRSWEMKRLSPTELEISMEDLCHALHMVLSHDSERITKIDAYWVRRPMTSCLGAEKFLSNLEGARITDDLQALGMNVDEGAHCTHLFDTCRLGISHIAKQLPDRRYDILIPDTPKGAQPVRLHVDGKLDLEIEVEYRSMVALSPAWLEGAPLLRGLAKWAKDRVSRETFEKLVIIQRSLFVSRVRRIDMLHYDGTVTPALMPPKGTCFGSQAERFADSRRTRMTRENLTPETILQFDRASTR